MVRLIAFFLPQYYPTDENNLWWGKGFTEWTNVALSRPLFKGHNQPQIPGELGFYDLRLEQTRIDQAKLAKEYGIEGFIYWHYWLGENKTLLDLPFKNLLSCSTPDYPYCLAWANHSWKGVFFGAKNRILVKQDYGGMVDFTKHFYYVLPAFKDSRYMRVDGKPIFYIFNPKDIPDIKYFINLWNSLAKKEGLLEGIHFIGEGIDIEHKNLYNLNGVSYSYHRRIASHRSLSYKNKYLAYLSWQFVRKRGLQVYEYKDAIKFFLKNNPTPENEYPQIIPNWDTTPRLKKDAVILHNSTPKLFGEHVKEVLESVKHKRHHENNLIFIKSWNEWAEGNYLEPSWKYQRQYLQELKSQLDFYNSK